MIDWRLKMNIKSLLLGSAAALAAVSGARGADAVVIAEPEPVEYVRVCDTYGAGFYYIPGTETCMSISGLLRYDIDWNTREDVWVYHPEEYDFDFGWAVVAVNDFDDPGFFNGIGVGPVAVLDSYTPGYYELIQKGGDEGWQKTAMARVNIDVRSETEFGTFRRFIRLEGTVDSGENNAAIDINFAYIELGGLLVGLYDTLYDGEMSPEFDEGGGSRTHQIRYTFSAGNGIIAQIGLEEEDYNYDYTPNVVGRLAITQGWGSLAAFAAYDATEEEFALKAIAGFNVTDAITLEAMGIYESGYSAYSVQGPNFVGYEWSLAGAVSFKANDKFTVRAGGQYFGDSHFGGYDEYYIGGQVDYQVVDNLLLRAQVRYNGSDSPLNDFWDGKIRLESSF
jgi:hypothetical protein